MRRFSCTRVVLPVLGTLVLFVYSNNATQTDETTDHQAFVISPTTGDSLSHSTSNTSWIVTAEEARNTTLPKEANGSDGSKFVERRSKRQCDVNTCGRHIVTGIRAGRRVTRSVAIDIKDLLLLLNDQKRRRRHILGSSRAARSIHSDERAINSATRLRRQAFGSSFQSYEYSITTSTRTLPNYSPITQIQGRFYNINYDIRRARRFQSAYESRPNAMPGLIVVDQSGVDCEDVCDSYDAFGVAFGTIGICTPYFCECNFSSGRNIFRNCREDSVFDILSNSCRNPNNVVLCDDVNFRRPSTNGGFSNYEYSEYWSNTLTSGPF